MKRLRFLVASAVVLGAVKADAQVYYVPDVRMTTTHEYAGKESPVSTLDALHKAGQWTDFQKAALALIDELATSNNTTVAGKRLRDHLGETDRNYYRIVWPSPGDDGKTVINSVLVKKGMRAEHRERLLGVDSGHPEHTPPPGAVGVRDVLLLDAAWGSLTSVWMFTPVADPLVAQIPSVVERINPLGIVASAAKTLTHTPDRLLFEQPPAEEKVPKFIVISVNEPRVLIPRAKIEIRDVVSSYASGQTLKDAVAKANTAVRARQARSSPCAKELAKQIVKSVGILAESPVCSATNDQTGQCGEAMQDRIKTSVATLMESPGREICAHEQSWGPAFDPLTATEEAFLAAVEGGGKEVVKGEAVLNNTPLTRHSFGVMTGLIVGRPTLDVPRVKADGGKIVEDPLDRVMTMVILNVHPRAYDAEWPVVSKAERFRLFGGAVLTPDVGLTTGVGYGIVRGLSVNIGGVFLWSKALAEGQTLDAAPVDGLESFDRRWHRAGFVGLSYVFK